ncbi:cleavage and polyadenylation specificity factor subunit 1 isoform X1 [Tanacetum coccineum]
MKGAISAVASLQGYLLVASGPKIILHKWTGSDLSGVAFFDAPPLVLVRGGNFDSSTCECVSLAESGTRSNG